MKTKPVFKSIESKNAILSVYDSLLEQWPVPFEKLTVKTRHGDTFVIACGEKSLPPLILIHGSSSNSAMWIGDVSTYCRHYRVYAVDIPGEPGRSNDNRLDLKTSAYAEWLDDVLTALKTGKVAIVGISLGGWTALKYSVTFPDRIDKLVLLCPSGIGPQRTSFMFYVIPMMLLGKWGLDKITRKIYGGDVVSVETLEYGKLIVENFNPFVGVVPLFDDNELKRLTMPVMLIVGEKDVLLNSQKTAERTAKLLPQAHINLLRGAGHVLLNLQDKIASFLTSNER